MMVSSFLLLMGGLVRMLACKRGVLELTGFSLQAASMPRRLSSLSGTWESRSLNSKLRKY